MIRFTRLVPAMLLAVSLAAVGTALALTAGQQPARGSGDDSPVAQRPLLTRQEYEQLAADLRQTYSKPPSEWPAATVDEGVAFVELGLLPEMRHPAENPYSKEKAELGRLLFFDPRISGSGQIACASCHDPDLGWADGRTVSFGHGRQAVKRNAPSIVNSGYNHTQFWDGRAESLEEQAMGPIMATDEMHAIEDVVLERMNAIPGYREKFKAVFGDDRITLEQTTKAIATFERTVVSSGAKFDAFMRGNKDALSDAAVRGLHLFRTDARCANCHHGPNLTDHLFHDLGLSNYGREFEDLGRYVVTKDPKDVGAFKTPSLRNVMRTAPYMHSGLFEMDVLLTLYNAGMFQPRPRADQKDDPLFPTKSHLLKPLGLNERDMADLQAFLDSLSDSPRRVRPPELPANP